MKKTTKPGSQASDWAPKVLALIRSGNADGAINQIRVAPTVKDLLALQKALAISGAAAGTATRTAAGAAHVKAPPVVVQAVHDAIAAMSAPRLHRSP